MGEALILFMVIVKTSEGPKGLGRREFVTAPQFGHFITGTDEAGLVQVYEVLAVIHPLDPATSAGDLIVKHVGTQEELRARLMGEP